MVVTMMLLCIFIVAMGVYIIGKIKDTNDLETYSEKKVGIAEVKEELSFGIYAGEDWDTFFDACHKEYLTNEILEQLLQKLGLGDYIELPEKAGRRAVTREEWNLVYGQILDLLDMEHAVQTETLLILDSMEAENAQVLITNQGDYYTTLPAAYFEKWNGYEIYSIKDRCLGIVGISAKELSVSNAYLKQWE